MQRPSADNVNPHLLHLTIDGTRVAVTPGTTVAGALAASAQADASKLRATRTSVSGMPRAALCGMGVCQECRVTIDGRRHVLACQTLCRDGQSVETTGPR
ncbi:2Fe-2S iron-sulfur cluster-binding protein [Paraburkholderia sp.]|uniref:2Fe-2S iron-sulfur cluster-binding protein n=1 Tax=Paraburkholderia sp. TaxID=1926495 RepID=UPI00238D57BA|nr:2Fe-2S iron-sulfur cluster-binding protein [Paraburkholderia sp.]MDE1179672.1 2Fe-2S iron-sulfur cluster-binding protein [Paraburkholderia sp.]